MTSVYRSHATGLLVDVQQDEEIVSLYDVAHYQSVSKICGSMEEANKLYEDLVLIFERTRQELKAKGLVSK